MKAILKTKLNNLLAVFTLLLLSTTVTYTQELDSLEQKNIAIAITQWADSTFANHEGDKFEKFKAFYTDDYFIQSMRLELYQDKIDALKKKKENGEYHDTEEAYNNSIKKLSDALESAKNSVGNIETISYIQTHYWSNIQTKDGITVYYEIILKLDSSYKITEAVENSSIGKPTTDTKIAYKNLDGLILVKTKQ